MTSQYLDTPLTVGRARSPKKTDDTFCQVGGDFEDVFRKCRYNVQYNIITITVSTTRLRHDT